MADRWPVLVDPHFRRMEEIFSAADQERLYETVEVVWGRSDAMPIEEARAALANASAVVCSGWRYGDVLDAAPNLRAVIDVGGAFPRELDYETCFARQIRVLTAAPAFGPQVAEMALGMALAACREIVAGDRAMREGTERYSHAGNQTTFMLYGRPVGLIGFGALGRCLLPLLQPFRCEISVYDPWLTTGYLLDQGVEPATLEQIIEESRVIFVLASPTSENAGMLSRSLLERIQPRAVIVLISRAHVVDFDALTELVLAGRFKAAIDVFPQEPLPPDHPIRQAPAAVLSAHRAGSVREGLWRIGELVVDDLDALTRGLPPQRLQVAQPETVGLYTLGGAHRRPR